MTEERKCQITSSKNKLKLWKWLKLSVGTTGHPKKTVDESDARLVKSSWEIYLADQFHIKSKVLNMSLSSY